MARRRGGDVADAQHAAVAIELGATWARTDSGFGRLPGLRRVNLLTGEARVNDLVNDPSR